MTIIVNVIIIIAIITSRTGISRIPLLGAGGFGYDTLVIVTKCVDVIINITVVASCAGVGCIAFFGAGRLGYIALIIVTKCIRLLSVSVTALTGVCVGALLGTSGFGSCHCVIML